MVVLRTRTLPQRNTPMKDEQKAQVDQWIKETLRTLDSEYIFNDLEIEFNDRYIAKMGMARQCNETGALSVHFSTQLWAVANDTQRKQTVVHEICHIVSMDRGIFDSHGSYWQGLMLQCGHQPNRCTTVQRPDELRNADQRVIKAKCKCKTHTITKNRATRIKKGSSYRCLSCLSPISLVY